MRALILAFVFLCLPARAVTFSSDVSDLWSNANEQGWGAAVYQQNEVVFIALYVYNQGQQPVWYVGSNLTYTGVQGTALVWQGQWYQVTGPYFGGPFNPNLVNARLVGNASFALTALNGATLQYSVDGVVVTKTMTRQTFRQNDLTGSYLGGAAGTFSNGCALSGYRESASVIPVNHVGNSISFTLQDGTSTCTFVGVYQQYGRLAGAQGTYSCGSSVSGTWLAEEIDATIYGFSARFNTQQGSCSSTGKLGGVKRN